MKQTFIATWHPAALFQDKNRTMRSFLIHCRTIAQVAQGAKPAARPRIIYNPTKREAVAFFRFAKGTFALDVETISLQDSRILTIAVARRDRAMVWNLQDPRVSKRLNDLQDGLDAAERVVMQNADFDVNVLRDSGWTIEDVAIWDTMLEHQIYFPDEPVNLSFLSSLVNDVPAWKHLRSADPTKLMEYNAWDAWQTDVIYATKPDPDLVTPEMQDYVDYRMPTLYKTIMPLNRTGVKLDQVAQQKLKTEHVKRAKTWKKRLLSHCEALDVTPPLGWRGGKKTGDWTDNVSPKRSATLLYDAPPDGLGLTRMEHPKSGATTTDADALKKLEHLDHTGTVTLLLERSGLKDVETPSKIKPDKDGLVRSRFVFGGDEKHDENELGKESPGSGRLASREPNLQNIKEWIRCIFISRFRNGWLLKADYCLAPDTRVLKADLTWVQAAEIQKGEELIGFDKRSSGSGRKFKGAVVEEVKTLRRPCYKVVTDKGTVVASAEHLWLCRTTRQQEWLPTESLEAGDHICFYAKPWETDESREAGYLAGFFDGEGYYHDTIVGFGQKEGPTLEHVKKLLKFKGFDFNWWTDKNNDVAKCVLRGPQAAARFLGSIRPTRLMGKARTLWDGRRVWGRNSTSAKVLSVEDVGVQQVVALQTSTRTLIAEGLLSHNSQIELRFIAYFSGDLLLAEATETDAHLYLMYLVDEETGMHGLSGKGFQWLLDNKEDPKVKRARKEQKAVNFGWPYLMGAKKIENKYGVPYDRAKKALTGLNRRFYRVVDWWASLEKEVKRTAKGTGWGYLTNPFGRIRRFFPEDKPAMCAFKPSSTAADVLYDAMDQLGSELGDLGLLCLTIHDEVVIDTRRPEAVAEVVRSVMERPIKQCGNMVIPTEVKVGKNWAEATEENPEGVRPLKEWRKREQRRSKGR